MTLGDVMVDTFPRLIERVVNDNGDLEFSKLRNFELVIQGVEADLNTPMYWAQLNLSYLDNFLYVSIHLKS